ncbi:hypothetical protein [Albidovulum sp.]|uniref:hypothetical protein n=1 Tax=Albidovulum sp. TaxID=1872424 RepID=UPI0025BEE6DA|nr:hypothetical protein [Defluviimonas sp.]
MRSLFKTQQPKSYGHGFDRAARKADAEASARWWRQNSLVPFERYDEHEERAADIAA